MLKKVAQRGDSSHDLFMTFVLTDKVTPGHNMRIMLCLVFGFGNFLHAGEKTSCLIRA